MDIKDKTDQVIKEFKLTTQALKNRNTVYILAVVIAVFGLVSYRLLPKELFPDIDIPYVMVQTTYPGNSPLDIENLVTRPLEKEIEPIDGIKEMSSVSAQDASVIFVEFTFDKDIDKALQDVKDAVDQAKSELPDDLPSDPFVNDIDFSEFPFININLSGEFSIDELKEYAEILEDRFEGVSEVSKVRIQGLNEKEIKVNVDKHKMQALDLSFRDIENAISSENVSIAAGEIKREGTLRSVRTVGEFESVEEMRDIVIKNEDNNIVHLKDVAVVINGYEDPSSITRLNREPVVSVQVIKKGGENLLEATSKVKDILEEIEQDNVLPGNLKVTITNDQSDMVKMQLTNLENSMVISIIFVVMVLFFFLGTRNAIFVGIAIPLSMFLSFAILGLIDYRINMIVLFSLILALGMLVDNAIVTVENIHRHIDQGLPKFEAARRAVGEIAVPIIASTATTLAAFIPLAFWDSITGEFMRYLPITLIIVLTSSLFVALVIIPVLSSAFVKPGAARHETSKRQGFKIAIILTAIALIFYMGGLNIPGSLFLIGAFVTLANVLFFSQLGRWFQDVFLVWLEDIYLKVLKFALRGKKPYFFFVGTLILLVLTVGFYFSRNPKFEFFPENEPSYINILAELPIGTSIEATDEFMKDLEKRVINKLEPHEEIVKSVLTNVGSGAVLENEGPAAQSSQGGRPNKGLITVNFVDYEFRQGVSTSKIMKDISRDLSNRYPGVGFTIEKNRMGPPVGKPVNIEISGQEYDKLIRITDSIQYIIESEDIEGIENLKMDLNIGKPEMLVSVDRKRAGRFGLSTGQVASTIRTALYGKDVSDFKIGEDEYPIQLRLMEKYRYSVPALMNQEITFRNNRGRLISVPISAVADYKYSTTYSSVKRKNLDRVITLSSNVVEGYNATEINEQIKVALAEYDLPEGYEYRFTGEQQDQQESMEFLERALLIALSLILIILVTQFNSLIKPVIIMVSVVFSTIGVFGGLATFNMNFVVVMTGIGIVSLAGVVVNNAIVLIDYIDLLKARRRKELGMEEGAFLPLEEATDCVIRGGKTRLRPVLLTAITTILGLLPMAIGMNIDFPGLLRSFDPNIYFGGDASAMWGPISWTVIFGLAFATFLTLVIVPVMYRISTRVQIGLIRLFEKTRQSKKTP
ncbi:MAG: efflux RND transporter permease subunit [Bacteroidales bacterium]|nr:efflux RND transporter permease subunit [Bacteroidales bacterium]